jgi:hypothetical protein
MSRLPMTVSGFTRERPPPVSASITWTSRTWPCAQSALQTWQQLARAVFVTDRHDCLAYVEYVTDQNHEPKYGAALEAVQQAAME